MKATGIPNGLMDVGYTEDDVDALTEGAYPQRRLMDNAPVSIAQHELKAIYRDAAILEVSSPRIAEALELVSKAPWARETSVFGDRLHVVVSDEEAGVRATRQLLSEHGLTPIAIERVPPSLEDVFIYHVSSSS